MGMHAKHCEICDQVYGPDTVPCPLCRIATLEAQLADARKAYKVIGDQARQIIAQSRELEELGTAFEAATTLLAGQVSDIEELERRLNTTGREMHAAVGELAQAQAQLATATAKANAYAACLGTLRGLAGLEPENISHEHVERYSHELAPHPDTLLIDEAEAGMQKDTGLTLRWSYHGQEFTATSVRRGFNEVAPDLRAALASLAEGE